MTGYEVALDLCKPRGQGHGFGAVEGQDGRLHGLVAAVAVAVVSGAAAALAVVIFGRGGRAVVELGESAVGAQVADLSPVIDDLLFYFARDVILRLAVFSAVARSVLIQSRILLLLVLDLDLRRKGGVLVGEG